MCTAQHTFVLWLALQARAEAVSRSLSEVCEGLGDKNATAVGEAVLKCPERTLRPFQLLWRKLLWMHQPLALSLR